LHQIPAATPDAAGAPVWETQVLSIASLIADPGADPPFDLLLVQWCAPIDGR
jgi:hypothetical protein